MLISLNASCLVEPAWYIMYRPVCSPLPAPRFGIVATLDIVPCELWSRDITRVASLRAALSVQSMFKYSTVSDWTARVEENVSLNLHHITVNKPVSKVPSP